MKKLVCTLVLAAALAATGCDDVLKDFGLGLDFYTDPYCCSSGPVGYYDDLYVEEYWYEEEYYEEDWWYLDDWFIWP